MNRAGVTYVVACLAVAGCSVLTSGVLDDKPPKPIPSTGTGGTGGSIGPMVPCNEHSDCPGIDATCRFRVCDDGFCAFGQAPAGTGCSEDDGTKCDGNGSCVQCLGDDDCTGDDKCISGACAPLHCTDSEQNSGETGIDCGGTCPPCANGQNCTQASDCISNLCSGGTCQPCTNHGDCAATPGTYCAAGVCVPKKTNGDVCATKEECASGACAQEDQTCCDRDCFGCESCLQQHSGLPNGTCGAVADGADPHQTCSDAGAASCDEDGQCDGSGSCRLYASGTSCSMASCSSGMATFDGSCDGAGTCNAPQQAACAPYTCSGTACRTSCSAPSHCSAGNVCVGGSCVGCGNPGPANGMCTAICNGGCNAGVCTINCVGGASGFCDGGITCPPGLDCVVNCMEAQSCMSDTITCPTGRNCTVNCNAGNFGCQNGTVVCADGPCTLQCGAPNDCAGTTFQCGANSCNANCNGQSVSVTNSAQSCNYTPSGC